MSDVETWLREQLQSAVPESIDSSGLLAGVHEQAVRARRVRVAALTCAVVAVLAVAGAVLSGTVHPRALTPARPVSHLSCAEQANSTAARLPLEPGPVSGHLRQVLVCADRTARSVWQGFLPQDEAVSFPGPLDYLTFATTQPQPCPAMPSGPSYRFLLLDQAGQVTAIDNRSLACNGWPALNRYFIALGDQVFAERQVQLADPFPACPSMLHAQLKGSTAGPAALRKGTVFTQATLCWHPLADPRATPAKEAVPVGRVVFSAAKLAILNAEVARHGSTKGRVTCVPDPAVVGVIHAVTTTGDQISLTGPCLNSNLLYVNGAQDDTFTMPNPVVAALTQ